MEAEVKRQLANVQKLKGVSEKFSKLADEAEKTLREFDSPGSKEARKASAKSKRKRVRRNGKLRAEKITAQPLPTGQIPQKPGGGKRITSQPLPSGQIPGGSNRP